MGIAMREHRVLFDNIDPYKKEFFLSIAIPTFKRFDLIKEALDSVFSQKFDFSIEVIVVDNDPENDELVFSELCEYQDKPMRYIKNRKNEGMFENWNQCLLLARGQYIMLLHDDDFLLPSFAEYFSSCMHILKENSRCNAIALGAVIVDQRKEQVKRETPFVIKKVRDVYRILAPLVIKKERFLSKVNLFFTAQGTAGVIFKRKLAIDIGGFNSEYYPISDWEFWFRWTGYHGEIFYCKSPSVAYRIRENESLRPETMKLSAEMPAKMRMEWLDKTKVYHWVVPLLKRRDELDKLIAFSLPSSMELTFLNYLEYYILLKTFSIIECGVVIFQSVVKKSYR